MTETMRAAVLYADRDLRVVDVPKPELRADSVLIEVNTVGICGTDLHTYKTGIFKEMSLPQAEGVLFGHEFSGVVAAIGDEAQVGVDLAPGDRVTGIALGAYAEYCQVGPGLSKAPMILKLPDAVSFEEAATVEPLTVSLSAVKRAALEGQERVLIIGAGMIGLGCVQVLNALYPDCHVTISDISAKRLAMAAAFGADVTVNAAEQDLLDAVIESTGERQVIYNQQRSAAVDVVIEAAGLEITLGQALAAVKPHTGRVVVVALYEDVPRVDFNQVVSKNVDILGVLAYSEADTQHALDLMASGAVDRKPLITHRFDLESASEAFRAQINTVDTLKAVIQP